MKVSALKDHKCYCCGAIVKKGDECFAFFVSSSNPNENEFDVIYACLECIEKETCKVRIKRKGAAA